MDETPASTQTPARSRNRLSVLLGSTTAAVLVADQVSKYLAVARLKENVPYPLIDGLLQLRLIRNPDAAFSLRVGSTWVFTIIASVVTVVIIRIARRLGSRGWAIALGLLLGGAVGNLLDRLFRAPGFGRGHVVDFIEYLKFPFMDFPIFNIADSCIVVAAGLIAVLGFLNISVDGRRPGSEPVPVTAPDEPQDGQHHDG